MDERITQALIAIVGEENYTDTLIDMVSYSYDASEHSHRPSCGLLAEAFEQVKQTEAASAELFKLAIDLDGALTGEHGIGISKTPLMTLEHDPVAMEVMRRVKKTFDPNTILNPGKMALEG